MSPRWTQVLVLEIRGPVLLGEGGGEREEEEGEQSVGVRVSDVGFGISFGVEV